MGARSSAARAGDDPAQTRPFAVVAAGLGRRRALPFPRARRRVVAALAPRAPRLVAMLAGSFNTHAGVARGASGLAGDGADGDHLLGLPAFPRRVDAAVDGLRGPGAGASGAEAESGCVGSFHPGLHPPLRYRRVRPTGGETRMNRLF